MVFYEQDVKKAVAKRLVPEAVFKRVNNALIAIDTTKDLGLFDTKKLKSSGERTYYRLRKGKYRAIFYVQDGDYYVISIAKREEAYDRWE